MMIMLMIMTIVMKANYEAKKFPRILWCFLKTTFYNVDNFIPNRMSDNICHNNKITIAIKYLPMSHRVMTSSVT